MKYLIVLIVVVVVLALLLGKRRGGRAASQQRRGEAPEGMVRCAHCGIHLPRSEALLQGGRAYCSTAHLEQDRRSA